jgi:hypothetical protein
VATLPWANIGAFAIDGFFDCFFLTATYATKKERSKKVLRQNPTKAGWEKRTLIQTKGARQPA